MEFFNYLFYCVALVFSTVYAGETSGSLLDCFVGLLCILFLLSLGIAVIWLIILIVNKAKKKKAALNKENKKDFIK